MTTVTEDIQQQQAAGMAFASEHLRECCAEIGEWQQTSILRNGRVRELARLLSYTGSHNALALAQSTVQNLAMRNIAAGTAEAPLFDGHPEVFDDASIVSAVHAGIAMGRVGLTYTDKNGVERPTHVCAAFLRHLLKRPAAPGASQKTDE